MKILTHIHAYPPFHNAGAEWMQHAILRWLVDHKHECHVLTTCEKEYEFEGVKVYPDNFANSGHEWRWCDIGFTHLARAGKAWNWAAETKKPIIYTLHNSFTNRLVEVKTNFALVFNTEWIEKDSRAKGYRHYGFVLHPPVWFNDYHTETNKKYITLINCWERKGGKMLIELAKAIPDREFLGVMGGYGEQERAELPNLTYIANTPTIKDVYAQSQIVLMPSAYESYGRVAVEAMCSGIPVVCTGTDGLREALGDCGTYVDDWQDVESFKKSIELFDKTEHYEYICTLSIDRAKQLNDRNETELNGLVEYMKTLIQLN
jgi:glycosyltransferase involved in cell wall biosynthesis